VNSIKALTFDVFGTVVDWRTSVTREGEALGKRNNIEADWVSVADAWRACYAPAMEEVRAGRREWVKLDQLHRENLMAVLKNHSIEGLSEEEIDDFNCAWHRLDPWPDSVLGLTRLKQKFILGTMSNGNISLMVNLAKYGGLPWDAILGSEIAHNYKPMPEVYLSSAAALSLEPNEIMMVAAHNSDLVHAGKLGFRTAFISRPTEYGPDQSADLKAENEYDYVASSMEDLADQLLAN
jgi:2-haloacid dehalogenase